MNIQLKPAQDSELLADINELAFVDNKTFDDDLDMSWYRNEHGQRYFKSCTEGGKRFCLVAWDGDRAVGYVSGIKMDIDYRLSNYFELENLGVIPEYRSKGVAKLLTEAITAHAKSIGCNKLFLSCYAKNKRALGYYEHLGFEPIDINLEKAI